jgi:serine/threonine protein kinase/tetratricopeptide (TPR) repeat protein
MDADQTQDARTTSGIATPGATLGSYRIERRLGHGGMGVVFLAYDTTLHRPVALKVVDGPTDEETTRGRVLREARNAAALNHPNICTIHEVGEAHGSAFIAMEYVDGRSLRDRLEQGAIPIEEALRYGVQAADALAYAHDHSVVHRDFKAANIMMSADGRLKIVDFGLARRGDALVADATTFASAVLAGDAAGTPYAMAPEQVRGEATDQRTDIWALGVLLYEMVTGAKPFTASTTPELFSSILRDAPRPWPDGVAVEIKPVIERCLEKAPASRYQHAREVREALQAIQSGLVPPWIAWRYHLTRHPRLASAALLLFVAAAVVGLNVGDARDRLTGNPSVPPPIKLAVLPFENLTGDPEQEYFSDGLTDEMITQLGRLHPQRLRVIARSSAMQYKNHAEPVEAMRRELGVDYVLEGSARREGSRIRINATLIQVRDRTQRWSDSFDRELAGILTLQNDVARGISGALALTLLPADEARLGGAQRVAPDAYEAYLMGQSRARRLASADLDRALEYYETALKIDPNFALAHLGVSRVWGARVQIGLSTRAEEGGRADAALTKALALDDSLPEGHMVLANRATWVNWDWATAERSYRRALDLNPSLAEAHSFYSHYLYIMHRPVEGAAAMQRALELDPLNDLIQQFYGMTLRFSHRFEEGIAHARRVLQTTPNSPSAWGALTENLHQLDRFDESLAARRSGFAARGAPAVEAALNQGFAAGGYREAMRRAADVRAAQQQSWVAAQDYVRAGLPDQDLEWLERAYQTRNQNLPYISVAPVFDPVRQDARFRALLQRMNLPQ